MFQCIHHIQSILDNVNTVSVCSAVAKYQVMVVVKVVKVAGYTHTTTTNNNGKVPVD